MSDLHPTDAYGWVLSARAERDVLELPTGPAHACLTHVAERVVLNPRRLGGPLHDRWEGYWSCHVGEYRVIYRIDDRRHLVQVAHIQHRGKVYG